MRSVTRFLLGVPVALLLAGVLGAPAVAAAPRPGPVAPAAVTRVDTAFAAAPAPPTATDAPAGPNIKHQQQQADANVAERKLVMGIICAVLLIIVFFGHRHRAKSRVRKKNLQNAKG